MSGRVAPRVLPVYVVVPPRALLLDIAGPVEVLRMTNFAQPDLRFEVHFVGATRQVHSSVGLGLAGLAPLPARVPDDAMVLVSGSVDVPLGAPPPGAPDDAVCEDAIVAWLRRTIRPGMRLVTICAGALLAARAGLLDGCECTTHHESIAQLAQLAPRARVRENRLFVQDGERMTSAGVTAGVDLMLALVAREVGHAVAVAVARKLVVYLRRTGADPQLSPWLEGRNHLHPAIHRVQDAVGADPARSWTLPALAEVAATSPRHLSRLFNEHAAMSVTDYVNRMRVALARQLVVGSTLDMERVAERSGFASARQFRRAWGRVYAVPPARMRGAEG
jgi:transcriptional regulator GlxA family with amidase domain